MPEAPSVPQHYRQAIRSLRCDLDLAWRPELQRFAVVQNTVWKGRHQARVLTVCREDDGSFRQVDQRLVDDVRRQVWRDRNGHYDDRQVAERDDQQVADARRQSQNELEAHRDELLTRVRLAKWSGRKR